MKLIAGVDRQRLRGWLSVLGAVAWVSWLRAGLIAAGPDIDTDAFDHAVIARRMLSEGRDLSIHWVWLPLWHALVALATRAGASLDAVRWINTLLSALSPLGLTALLTPFACRSPSDSSPSLPFIAGMALALWPLGLGVGEFAQPEALFAALLIGTSLAWERRSHLMAGLLCASACLLRYEAWVIPIALLALHLRERRRARGLWASVLPLAVIALWCLAHAKASGEWLRFVRLNRAYVREAWTTLGLDSSTELRVQHPWLWYPVLLPWQSLGASVALCPLGLRWLITRCPRSLALGSALILAFVTAVWVRRLNLGLPRHFVAVTPLYATVFAAGVCALVNAITARVPSLRPHGPGLALTLGILCLVHVSATRGQREALSLSRAHAASMRDEREVLSVLRASLRPGQRVFSDLPRVEAISGLGPERFIHWQVTQVGNFNMAVEATHHGAAYALSTPDRTLHLTRSRSVFANRSVSLVRRDRPAVIDRFLRNAPRIP